MLTKFCPQCFAMNKEAATNCEQCGAPLDEPIGSDYVERLIHALDHPEPNTRATAALILGKIGDQRALDALCSKAETSKDMALWKQSLKRWEISRHKKPLMHWLTCCGLHGCPFG
ncbi:HEAT repeat domain-containing protein [Fervidibacter sacchari]|uniref:HEAT repeat domain-containing protein n=1 Tax=Candidatus Fervidibacter sacchari TaxID=1448929 RepID=UPI0026763DD1|nr:HEAT repeat domain-containing protein [Candidatus Fervidibacter sacchari]WKU15053.1 HEAT repeat domain-containing protein [Candidatus Fervidibacter sacchari]